MKKTIVVIGATGIQGGSVCRAMSADPDWEVKGLTRDKTQPKATALMKLGIGVVEADLADTASLVKAFAGAHAIFSVTDSWALTHQEEHISKVKPGQQPVEYAFEEELRQGCNVFDAASTVSTLERVVFSSLPNVRRLSQGKYDKAYHFDAKALALEYAEEHHHTIWTKTSVLQMGFYLSNFILHPWMAPHKNDTTGLYEFNYPVDRKIPFVDAENDPGVLTRALIRSNEVHNLAAYRDWLTLQEFAELWGRVNNVGATAKIEPIANAPAGFQEEIEHIFKFQNEYGYYGHRVDESIIDPPDLRPPPELATVEDWIRSQNWSILDIPKA